MKLAPQVYDPRVAERIRRQNAEDHQRRIECEAALAKVYGRDHVPASVPESPTEPEVPPRLRARCEELDGQSALFLEVAGQAFARYHVSEKRWLTLSQIAHLIEVTSTLGRLVVGMDTDGTSRKPQQEFQKAPDYREALERIYGAHSRLPEEAQLTSAAPAGASPDSINAEPCNPAPPPCPGRVCTS